jgi:hypothetical protein
MNRRAQAMIAAALLAAAAFAQDIVPTWTGFHEWQYAALLVVLAIWPLAYIGFVRKGGDGVFGERFAVALIGALLIGVAGLACGLLGPDTLTVTRAPGTVVPLPDVGVAAFFPNADAAGIANGDADLLLRRRGGVSTAIAPGGRRFLGSFALELHPRHAAYVEVRDARGSRLTVTQPTGSTFLSPVLLFPSSVPIGGQTLPADSFAVPAAHRRVEAMYFSPEAVRGTRAGQSIGLHPATLFAVQDDVGRMLPGGISLSAQGRETRAGGLLIRSTTGTYPELLVSEVPSPAAMWLGGVWLVLGSLWALGAKRKASV